MRLHATRRAAIAQARGLGNPLWDLAGVPASLDQRFAESKSLVDAVSGQNLITFTRASDGAVVNSAGQIEIVAANVPRFTHDPVTLESLGLLVEEQRQNLLLRSEEFDNVYWNLLNNANISANSQIAPNNTLTADRITETAANGVHYIARNSVSISAAGVQVSLSVYAKAAGRNFVGLQLTDGTNYIYCTFNLQTGVVSTPVNNGTGSGASSTIQNVGNGWYRCSLSGIYSSTGTAPVPTFYIGNSNVNLATTSYLGDGTSGILIWGAQLEVGAFPTSYIPTTGTAATRTADVVSITGANFSSWYRQDEMTIYAQGASGATTNFPTFAEFSDGTANNRIHLGYITPLLGGLIVRSASATVAELYPSVTTLQRRAAFGVAANNFGVSYNGAAVTSDASGAMPTGINRLEIGNILNAGATNNFNGPIRRLTYWPQRLPNSTLQNITL